MSGRGSGFTLLEVMVALALLAASFMALADLGGQALRNHAYARDLSAATLLARGKLAQLEEKYEDSGFKELGEEEDGDFGEEGRPDVRWKAELTRPDPKLSADQLAALLAGGEGVDPQGVLTALMGGGAQAAGAAPGSGSATSPLAAMSGQLLQTQLTAFGEKLKKSFRELRITVSWKDGKLDRSFAVTTHLVVLNPRAPGGARGDAPDVPPNLAAAAAATGAGAGAATGPAGGTTVPGVGAPSRPPTRTPRSRRSSE